MTVQPELSTMSWILSNQSTPKIGGPSSMPGWGSPVHPGLSRGGPDGSRELHEQATRPPFHPLLPLPLLTPGADWDEMRVPRDQSTEEDAASAWHMDVLPDFDGKWTCTSITAWDQGGLRSLRNEH